MTQVSYKQSDRALEAQTKRTRRELVLLYAALYAALRDIMAGAYERYAVGGVLTYSLMSRYNRLAKLEAQIRREVGRLGRGSRSVTEDGLREMYRDMYFSTGGAIETAAGIAIGYAVLRWLLVEESIASPVTGMGIGQRIFMHRDDLVWKVRQVVTRGLVRGLDYRAMMLELRKTVTLDAVRAQRWVNTEAHRILNEARWQAGQPAIEKGIILRKMWVTEGDDRVRDTHQGMQGQIKDADAPFVSPSGAKAMYPGGFGLLEEDAGCRCEMIWITEGN